MANDEKGELHKTIWRIANELRGSVDGWDFKQYVLGFLFYRGYLKAIAISLMTFVVLLFLPGLTLGWDHNVFLLSEWWSIVNPSNKEHMFETDIGTHSLVALIPVYLTDTIGVLPQKRNFMNLNTAKIC